jgi:hypothetical protein
MINEVTEGKTKHLNMLKKYMDKEIDKIRKTLEGVKQNSI